MLDSCEPAKSRWMSGTAMLTMVASTNAMNVPSTATARTARGEDTRRVRAGVATVSLAPKWASLCQASGGDGEPGGHDLSDRFERLLNYSVMGSLNQPTRTEAATAGAAATLTGTKLQIAQAVLDTLKRKG